MRVVQVYYVKEQQSPGPFFKVGMESAGIAARHGQIHITAFLVSATGPGAEEDDFVTVPEGVTLEQLIEESKQYVDAIIVTKSPKRNDSPTVFLKTGDSDEVPDTEISIPESDTEGTADNQAEASDKDAEPEDTEEGQNTDK